MKRINALAIASFLVIAMGLLGLNNELDLHKIQNGNKRVRVTILDVPRSCEEGSYRYKPYFRFTSYGKIHIKDILADYCDEIYNNETIVLKTNGDYSGFLFENEDVSSEIAACIAIIATGILILFISLRNKKVVIKPGNYKKIKKPLQPKMGRYGNKI